MIRMLLPIPTTTTTRGFRLFRLVCRHGRACDTGALGLFIITAALRCVFQRGKRAYDVSAHVGSYINHAGRSGKNPRAPAPWATRGPPIFFRATPPTTNLVLHMKRRTNFDHIVLISLALSTSLPSIPSPTHPPTHPPVLYYYCTTIYYQLCVL